MPEKIEEEDTNRSVEGIMSHILDLSRIMKWDIPEILKLSKEIKDKDKKALSKLEEALLDATSSLGQTKRELEKELEDLKDLKRKD
ncbi:MAG: hypothetical protein QXL16_00965 [Candidatus Micrarchaeaceae archaeon]